MLSNKSSQRTPESQRLFIWFLGGVRWPQPLEVMKQIILSIYIILVGCTFPTYNSPDKGDPQTLIQGRWFVKTDAGSEVWDIFPENKGDFRGCGPDFCIGGPGRWELSDNKFTITYEEGVTLFTVGYKELYEFVLLGSKLTVKKILPNGSKSTEVTFERAHF